MNLIKQIIEYENGEGTQEEAIQLFSELIKNGQAWSLQGHYGRTAQSLIDRDIISSDGTINWDKINE